MRIWIPGNPVPQARPRFARIGNGVRTYDPATSRDWKNFVKLRAHAEGVKPIAQGAAITISITFHLIRPASISAKKRPHPVVKPDLDNLIKGVKDGLKGIAWHDDSQVCQMWASKYYTDGEPGVSIDISELAADF